MNTSSINELWGSQIEFEDPMEFFSISPSDWKKLLYERHLLVFKHMNISKEQYIEFCKVFGNIWPLEKYQAVTREVTEKIGNDVSGVFSNKTSPYLGQRPMSWHADVANHTSDPFPIRSLWMFNNPNKASGKTGFLELSKSIKILPDKLAKLIASVTVVQQNWLHKPDGSHDPFVNKAEFGLIKTHPITGDESLRLNYYNIPGKKNDGWICEVKINGISQDDCSLIQDYIDAISVNSMLYYHQWDTYDICIYDNWNLIHNRSPLDLPDNSERVIYRVTIDHMDV